MSLTKALGLAKTEEDVKDAYIKALGLQKYNKGLVDIRTDEIWFEAKDTPTSPSVMFAQLLCYVADARRKGEAIPPLLAVIDREKAALMETAKVFPLLADTSIKWPKSGSKVKDRIEHTAKGLVLKSQNEVYKSFAALIAPYIETHFVLYKLESHEKDFIDAVKHAIKAGKFVRTPITPDNLRQVFDKWVAMIGRELEGVDEVDYALLFFADIMHDGNKAAMADLPARLLHDGDQPLFLLNGKTYELSSDKGYRNFWAIYHRPPEEEHRAYLLERRDSLLPLDERSFKGAYYTPLHIVDKAYDLLAETLGKDWQKHYIVWDMCCGVGNLEAKHSNYRNVFMSTLDQADIDVMTASRTCVGAHKFQYDYLNDDVRPDGQIDYLLTDKVPGELRQAIADAKTGKAGAKKILVLINPPYGEANSGDTRAGAGKNKADIASTRVGESMQEMGYATRELFVQFLARIRRELPGATVALFSKLKYVNAPNFSEFREQWRARYLGGFVVHSQAFEGLKGNFPIGFLVWDWGKVEPLVQIETSALDKYGKELGKKSFYNLPDTRFLSGWLPRLKTSTVNIPLKNAIVPQSAHAKVSSWHQGAIGYLLANSNDMQNAAQLTALLSSVYSAGNGFYVTRDNLWRIAVVFAVRRLIKPTWLNDRDQFLQPTGELSDEFKSDCLIWMLFNGSNLTAGADGLEWNGRTWSLVNHFIPFTEQEVGAAGRFESDFMAQYIAGLTLSPEAQAVLDAGRHLWRQYHATRFEKKIRDEFKLNRPDVGWYQVRRALEANADSEAVDFEPFKAAYAALSGKLRPQVYELGFLRA